MRAPVVTVAENERGYRRGIVLGLTMAEMMLLLLFCLLLAAAGVFKHKESELADLKARATELSAIETNLALALPETKLPLSAADAESIGVALALLAEARARNIDLKSINVSGLAEIDANLRLDLERVRSLRDNPQLPMPEDNWVELVDARDLVATIKENGGQIEALLNPEAAKVMAQLSKQVANDKDSLVAAKKLLAALARPNIDVERFATPEMLEFLAKLAAHGFDPKMQMALDAALADGSKPGGEGVNQWPPIITLKDDGYSFARGSAEITATFAQSLREKTASELVEYLKTYNVDIIEVVGHTDEQPIKPTRPSNLDEIAIGALNGKTDSGNLIPVDNAGLGMARAIAVAGILRRLPELSGAKIIPYSAAQLVMPGDIVSDGSLGGDQKQRRRIEIRLRRSGETRE